MSRQSINLGPMRVFHRLAFATCTAALLVLAGCSTSRPPPSPTSSAPLRTTPPLTAEQAHDIAIHALGLVGTPYRYGGNTPQSGFDCSGLIGYVYKSSAGVAPPRTVAQLSGFGQPVNARERRTGDLVIFGAGRPFHAGIYVGEGRFVHAPSTGGTVRLDRLVRRSEITSPFQSPRIRAMFLSTSVIFCATGLEVVRIFRKSILIRSSGMKLRGASNSSEIGTSYKFAIVINFWALTERSPRS